MITVELCTICSDRASADALANFALFLPLGLALRHVGLDRRLLWAIPLLLSVGIEASQMFIPGRFTTLSDIVANTLGGRAGAGLPWLWRWWSAPQRASRRLWLGSAMVAGIFWGGATLLRPIAEPEADFAHWTPEFENLERWQGTVEAVRIGTTPVQAGWLPDTSMLLHALAAGASLQLRLVPAAPSDNPAPIFALTDAHRRVNAELLVVGEDLLWRQRHRGAALGLATAAARFEGLGARLQPHAPTAAILDRTSEATCLHLGGRTGCAPFPGIAGAWQLLYAPDEWSLATRRTLDLVTLSLLLLPLALVAPAASRAARLGVMTALIGSALMAHTFGPVRAPGVAELLIATLTISIASWGRRRTAAPPRLPATTADD